MGVSVRSVTVNLRADISDFQRKLAEAAAGSKAFASSLDDGLTKVNDKMGLLSSTIVALGPSLVPVLAGATVGVAALGTQLTFAAAGAGVAVLALSGVSDALKALDTYSGAPTQANLDALHAKLSELAPAGQSFVLFLDSLGPKLDQLRGTAEQGFLPGLQAGITSVMTQFPVVNQLVSQLAQTMGNLAREGGDALKSPFWHGFLTDFSRNASIALQRLSEGLGNIAHGLAGVFQAFIPVGDSVSQGLLTLTQRFAEWGQTLRNNQGFQEFIQYVERTGPETLATIGSIVKALLAIAKAAGPVGAATLPVIKALADGLTAVADSPAGPAIIGAAVAITSLAKALALLKAVGLVGGVSKVLGGVAAEAAGAEAAVGAAGAAGAAGGATSAATTAELAAGLGASATVGIIGGAAIGGSLLALYNGYSLAASGADKLATSAKNVDSVFGGSSINLHAQASSLRELGGQIASYNANQQRLHDQLSSTWNPYTMARDAFQIHFSQSGDTAAYQRYAQGQYDYKTQLLGLAQLRSALANANKAGSSYTAPGDMLNLPTNIAQLQKTADSAIPTLVQLGHTLPQIRQMLGSTTGTQELADELAAYNQQVSVGAKPTEQLKSAIADLDKQMIPTATATQNVGSALTGMLGPQLTNAQAATAWASALKSLHTQLAAGPKVLKGNSAAALQNQAALEGLVNQYQTVITAGAGVGESSAQFVAAMQKQYYALVHAGVQAGISRSNMMAYLKTLGLTPHTISTLVQVKGGDQATAAAKSLAAKYNALPKSVRTDLAANGIPANATADSLKKKYQNLSTQQVQTILKARDSASVVIDGVRADLARLNGSTATVYINTQATGLHSGVQAIPNAAGNLLTFATGGGLPAIGDQPPQTRYSGQGAVLWNENRAAPWETFISGDPRYAARSRSLLKATAHKLGGDAYFAGGYRAARMQSAGYEDSGLASQVGALRSEIAALRSSRQGVQRVHVDNATEVATGVRGVARDQVNQAASYNIDIEDLDR